MFRHAALAPALLLVAATGASAPLPINPGKWQTVYTVTDIQAQGIPAFALAMVKKPRTVSYCITPEQAKQGPAQTMMQQKGCTVLKFDWKPDGHFVTQMTCTRGDGVETVTDTGVYDANSLNATGEVVQTGGHMPMTMKMTMVGKRLGGC